MLCRQDVNAGLASPISSTQAILPCWAARSVSRPLLGSGPSFVTLFSPQKGSIQPGQGFYAQELKSVSSLFQLWRQSLFSIKCRCVSCSGLQLLTTKGQNKRASVLRWFQNKVKCYISCSHFTSSDFALEDSITSHTTRERLCAEMSGFMRQRFVFLSAVAFHSSPSWLIFYEFLYTAVHRFP